ncbi:MAG: nuclear transport factor 2 family protein [Rubrivivax sp.]|nr:nuclear transport factor 2 family protein [Rubrivivax sp.]
MDTPAVWHAIVKQRDPAALDALLADDVVFHSSVVHPPQVGRAITAKYLAGALRVLNHAEFHYVREIVGPRDAVLEFTARIDDVLVNGVDLIRWGDDGRITEFKVMVRLLKAVHALRHKMGELLQREP